MEATRPPSARREVLRRSLRKRRRARKLELVEAQGGRCAECGYSRSVHALDFHHRDPAAKEFAIGGFGGSRQRLRTEVAKCDLLCANCHRLRHAAEDLVRPIGPVGRYRRRAKVRAVEHMGGRCQGCSWAGLPAVFEFHHLDPAQKSFGITQDGIPRRWERVVAELAKCVMLCANCHREVHAGARELDEGLLGLAETAGSYAA